MHQPPDRAARRELPSGGGSWRHPATPDTYTIHVGAPLGPEWAEWLSASEILARDDGSGLIAAAVRDQAMLFGLLARIRDLGVPLLGLYPGCSLGEPGREPNPRAGS